ncbi:hypothetical protein JHK85_001426 [Glycine max]|nr:hypothetical protein JHK85_001426 [Glycine max]KAG5088780.1 hypothetical protein JHK86_001392 [Glycine max]
MQALGDIAFAHSYSLILGEPCKLLGVKCGIYGANSAEWIMSMQSLLSLMENKVFLD